MAPIIALDEESLPSGGPGCSCSKGRAVRTGIQALERSERAAGVRSAMARLSPADREILLLKEYESLSTAEIAKMLDRKPEAIRQRYSRAVRRLGDAYRQETSEDTGSA